jgi:serine/threonine protein kinase
VLVREDGHVTLAGLSHATGPGIPEPYRSPTRVIERSRFRHMSREQVRGMALTPATDLFSLAVMLATVACGSHPLPPFDSDFDTLRAISDHRHVVPGDTPLLRLLRSAIVPDAAARPSLSDFTTALAELGAPDPARIARLVAAAPA